ncbi:hypothetical protein FBR02_14695 [Anaerolineae bacterium CFX9]|nr:hypothetical protein [Anaerolineae bacterium CFX9]
MSSARSRRARVSAVLFAALILVVTTLPYLVGAARQTADWRFSGFVFGADDGSSYLGKMRQGGRGEWAFSIFYTPERHAPVSLVYLPYIAAGWLIGGILPHTDPAYTGALIVGFHIFRVLASALLMIVLWRFIGRFARAPRPRLTAFVLAIVGGGFGWALVISGQDNWLGSLPPEFYIPEGFGFLVVLGLPHVALARAALLGGLMCLLPASAAPETFRARPSLMAGALWIIVGLCVPFYLAVIYAVLAAWIALSWLKMRQFPRALCFRLALAGAITLPLFAYYSLAFAANDAFALWSAQNLLPSPHPLQYAVAYGALALLALPGGIMVWRRSRRRGGLRYLLLIAWALIVPLLVYLPINVQRRTAEAVIVPLALLAAFGLERVGRAWVSILTVFVLSLSTFLIFGGALLAANVPRAPIFVPGDTADALIWLNQHGEPDAVVLSLIDTGSLIPVYSGLRSYVGHGPETLDYDAKAARAEAFFRGELSPAERDALLDGDCLPRHPTLCAAPVRYLLVTPNERALMVDDSPLAGWALIHSVGEAGIYERQSP